MVRRALPLLVLALLLSGCGFFTMSLFPGYLAQAEMSADLGPKIDEFLSGRDYLWHSQLFVLRSNAPADYAALFIEIDSLPDKLLLLVDPSGGVHPIGGNTLGRLHLKDVNGNFVVGSLSFPPAGPYATTGLGISSYSLGFSDGSFNYLLRTDGSNLLYWDSYNAGWTTPSPGSTSLHGSQTGYELRNVYYDPDRTDQEVVLVIFNYQLNRVYVLFTPLSGYTGAGFLTPLLSNYPYLELEDVDASNVIYTRKGIVVDDHNGHMVLKDFNGQDTGKGLDLGQRRETRLAFDLEGDHVYAFNDEDRRLYWGKTGW